MSCANCGAENLAGGKFCHHCGSPLQRVCPSCGSAVLAVANFCSECGTTLAAAAAGPAAVPAASAATGSPTELRHVSVLFCDLVGFTPLAERRDPEEVRELLSGYFELARAIVARYGGIVEKFIGDAVMAVWGAPVAKEDDAERAVRAGLELVSAVAAYGSEHQTELQARVGVVTGGVATTETPEEGLVIGDRVNTAARIQSAALPGCCYVDETTRTATSAAIAYVDAGEHELKGKAEPVHLFQATRVIAAVAGSQRSGVLEAPFIGRDHELRLVKELFHASAERHSARLVLVSGVAGVGKSRLAWEFFKYIDGLAGDVLWHAGRCLSYGEGVSYWALSEIVRARLQISEEDPLELVAERVRTGLERWIPDSADREFIAPRLGQLLGVPSPRVLAREELFSGWRLFFERLSEHLPVILVIEDLQWADAGMVDFLDHLLEWSGDHAIFLLVQSRPEGTDRKGLGLSRRSVTALPLDPLPNEVIGELLDGLVSGLPATARARIVERAEGIPLYAIETVRGLLDKGVVEKGDDGALHLVGELGELEIPPGLTALIASRLDALEQSERQLVKECSVLGGSFPRQAIEAVSDTDPADLDELLSSLVRKEVLTVRADKLSPERGQYAFTQSLIRSVAYDMLTRGERKARHLKTAEHLRSAFPDEGAEVAEVIGAHLYDAFKAAGEDPDADELRARACRAYVLAAERAESVGAPEAAESAYLRAAELSSDEAEQAGFTDRAGRMAQFAGWNERAVGHFETAIAAHAKAKREIDAARVTARLGVSLNSLGRGEQAVVRLREVLATLEETTAPPDVLADLQATLGGALAFTGHVEESAEPLERALVLAQHYELAEPLAAALVRKGGLLSRDGRVEEARALLEAAVSVARRSGITRIEMSAEITLADLCMTRDLPDAEGHCESALELGRRWGARQAEAFAVGNLMYIMILKGRFDEASQLGLNLLEVVGDNAASAALLHEGLAHVHALRGEVDAARSHFSRCAPWATTDDVQFRIAYAALEAAVALVGQNSDVALATCQRAVADAVEHGLPVALDSVRTAVGVGVEAALAAGDLDGADELVARITARPVGEVPPYLKAHLRRYGALRSARGRGSEDVEEGLSAAEAIFRGLGYPYWTARTQLDRAEWLAGEERFGESVRLAGEAAAVFETVGVAPMLARARALLDPAGVQI
jgi:class 3 adenylate cyclase/tetratricopeptide (TPR) repeat protein